MNNLNNYEVNKYYAGSNSQDGNNRNNNQLKKDLKKVKKNGKVYYSKENKIKKLNENEKKQINHLLEQKTINKNKRTNIVNSFHPYS